MNIYEIYERKVYKLLELGWSSNEKKSTISVLCVEMNYENS